MMVTRDRQYGFALACCMLASVVNASEVRIGMPAIPETLDVARADGGGTWTIASAIYDTLYVYDPAAQPAAIVPLAAVALPEVSPDYRQYTIKVRPGIFFTPHPGFGGRKRELTAADFAYAMRRVLDPVVRSPSAYVLEGKIEGLDALAAAAKRASRALDYDAPVAGLEVLDRMTLRIRLVEPDPLFAFALASPLLAGVAREAMEAGAGTPAVRPVGSGGYVVKEWIPGHRLTLERNPAFRELRFDDLREPASRAADHPMKDRMLPAVDRIVMIFTPEYSAELLALRNDELDLIYLGLPELALSNGRLKDAYARAGLEVVRHPSPQTNMLFFNGRSADVGGSDLPRIALRRAIAMAIDDDEYIRVIDAGGSRPREQLVPPGLAGHLAKYRNPNRFDPVTANALLDRFQYARGKDGKRRNADGSALVIRALIPMGTEGRAIAEFLKRTLDRLALRVEFEARWGTDRVRRMSQCAYGIAVMAVSVGIPDGVDFMGSFQSRAIGTANVACFADADFDAAYAKVAVMAPGPARDQYFLAMQTRLDALAAVRPLPTKQLEMLKQSRVLGPFPVTGDWLQIMTLGLRP